MARSNARTVEGYLDSLTPEQRRILSTVRKVVLEHLPDGYREAMNWGMISYELPLDRYSKTYNGQPLAYAGLAAQKNYFTLHLLGAYADPKQAQNLEKAFEKRGKKLDMGRACVRFKSLDDLPLDVVGKVIASMPPDRLIERFEASRRS